MDRALFSGYGLTLVVLFELAVSLVIYESLNARDGNLVDRALVVVSFHLAARL